MGRWQGGARRKKGEDMVERKKTRLNEICDKIKKRETQKYTQEERSVMRIG